MGATLVLVLALPQALVPLAEYARQEAAIQHILAMSRPVAVVSLGDSPHVVAGKKRLAALCEFVERSQFYVRKRPVDTNVFFNMLQVTRDLAQSHADVVNTPEAQFWAQWRGLEISEAMMVIYTRHFDIRSVPHANVENVVAQHMLYQGNVQRAYQDYKESSNWSWFRTMALDAIVQSPRPLPRYTLTPPPKTEPVPLPARLWSDFMPTPAAR